MISCSAFSETIAKELTMSLNMQKMTPKNMDNDSGIPSHVLKSTGITSDHVPRIVSQRINLQNSLEHMQTYTSRE